jgi:hypothetical protein
MHLFRFGGKALPQPYYRAALPHCQPTALPIFVHLYFPVISNLSLGVTFLFVDTFRGYFEKKVGGRTI